MKTSLAFALTMLFVIFSFASGTAQDDVTIVAPTSEAAEGLDLHVVSELFKDAENLEEFEKSLNDPDTGVNNLDLDGDGNVDFIRVVEEVADDNHLIILQAALGKDEFQDVCTIEVEKSGEEQYNMQVHGNEVIYGADYYVAPTVVHIHTWPLIGWMYRPYYRPYRSAFYFGVYPRWWHPYHHVTVGVYRTRTVRFTRRTTFAVTRTSRVRTVNRVTYKPRSSVLVKKKTTVTRTGKGGTKVRRTTMVKRKSTTVKKGRTKTTVKKGSKKTTVKKGRKKTTVKKGGKKTTVKKRGKKNKLFLYFA